MCIYIYLRVPIIRTVTLTGRATWMGGRGIGYRGNLPTPPRQRAPITKRILRARSDRTVPGRVRTNTERGERESEQGRGELGGSRLSELPRRGRPRPLFIPPVLAIVNSLSVCPSLPHFYPLHSSPLRSTSTRFVFYVIRISTVSFGSFFFYLSRFVFSVSSITYGYPFSKVLEPVVSPSRSLAKHPSLCQGRVRMRPRAPSSDTPDQQGHLPLYDTSPLWMAWST